VTVEIGRLTGFTLWLFEWRVSPLLFLQILPQTEHEKEEATLDAVFSAEGNLSGKETEPAGQSAFFTAASGPSEGSL
jgi:hypothetical protein